MEIRVLPLSGPARHSGSGHPDEHGHDYIAKASDELGALSYSVLRAEAMTLYRHRQLGPRGAQSVADHFTRFARVHEAMAAIDEGQASAADRATTRLMTWDLIALVGEAAEQLAAVFTAIHRWRASRTNIATTLLAWNGSAHHVFASPEFQDVDWWQSVLGLEPDADTISRVGASAAQLIRATFAQADSRLRVALEFVTRNYGLELHRLAIRRKHLAPLLDADLALVFDVPDQTDNAWLEGQVAAGALIVADDKVVRGKQSQIVLPVTKANLDTLFDLFYEANWLSRTLAGAVIGAAENPLGVAFVEDDVAPRVVGLEEFQAARSTYIGLDPVQTAEEFEIQARSREVRRLAEASVAEENQPTSPIQPTPINRQQRRAADRDRRRRS